MEQTGTFKMVMKWVGRAHPKVSGVFSCCSFHEVSQRHLFVVFNLNYSALCNFGFFTHALRLCHFSNSLGSHTYIIS